MRIGFTGTRNGMTEFQKQEVERILIFHCYALDLEAHHGDCMGADAQFHQFAQKYGYPIIIHPSNLNTRVYCQGAIRIYEPKNALIRNCDIVDSVDIMIATPAQNYEILRSGTWATIRYARKVGRVIHIIYPKPDIGEKI